MRVRSIVTMWCSLVLMIGARIVHAQSQPPVEVIVEPKNLTDTVQNGTNTYNFQIQVVNETSPVYVTLLVECTGVVTTCYFTPGNNQSQTILDSNSTTQTVTFVSSGAGGTGTLTVRGTAVDYPTVDSAVLTVVGLAPPQHRIRIEMAAGAMQVAPNAVANVGFTVTNYGSVTDTIYTTTICTGAGLTGTCSTSPSNQPGVMPDSTYTGTASATATGTAGALGRLKVVAYEPTHPGVVDTGYTDITVQPLSGPGVVLTGVAPTTTRPRDKCLAIEIRPGVAYECGDLRIAHALPSVRTYNRVRTPSLIYHTNIANGLTAIGALVTLDSTKGIPDTVTAVVTDSTGATWGTGRWTFNSAFAHGATQRITVVTNTSGLYYGVHWPYTMTVSAKYDSLGVTQQFSATGALVSQTGTLAGANEGEWGGPAGWRLAGWEQLLVTSVASTPWTSTPAIPWINAEGDTRLYSPVPGDSLVWAAAGVDRPDTIKEPVLGGNFIRYAEHGTQVVFNAHGTWLETIDRLGHVTTFGAGSVTGSLALTLPTPSGGYTYTFYRNSNLTQLDSVVAPGDTAFPQPSACDGGLVRAARKVCLHFQDLHEVDTIIDPDGSKEAFDYGETSGNQSAQDMLIRFTDKLGTVIGFGYDTAAKLDSVTVDTGEAPHLHLTTTFHQIAEDGGVTAPVAPDSAYTLMVGPRANAGDSLDITRFWIDQWGEPQRIRDPHGDEIELTRANATYPSLVTYARYQNGRVVTSTYDPRGNPQSTTDSSFSIGGTYATTQFMFDTLFDYVTEISRPAGEIVTFHYDSTDGNRLWQQPGTSSTRKVNFGYDPTTKLLDSIVMPVESPLATTVTYDATLANEATVTTPLGITTSTTRDAMGRAVVVHSPIDSTNTRTDSTAYDVMDRILFSTSHAPALTHNFDNDTALTSPYYPQEQPRTADSAALTVTTTYDNAGDPTTVIRQSLPDVNNIGPMETAFVYDAAGRAIQKTQYWGTGGEYTATDTTGYDADGNAVRMVTRRSDTITVTFDALNRMVQRLLPGIEYPRDSVPQLVQGSPSYPNCPDSSGGFCITADTATFAYDHVGNMILANNADAQITRAYMQNGDLSVDTLRIRAYANADFTQHVYGIAYTYDLDGRRLTMTNPSTLAPANSTGSQNTYTYDAGGVGELVDVTDVLGNVFAYQYDLDGRAVRLNSSDSAAIQHWTYDADSRLIARIDSTPNTDTSTNGWTYNEAHHDTLYYDLRGDVVMEHDAAPPAQLWVFNAYSGLGALADALIFPPLEGPYPAQANEQFTNADAFGNTAQTFNISVNQHFEQLADSASSYTGYTYEPGSGRLLYTGSFGSGTNYYANYSDMGYDSSGNLRHTLSSRASTVTQTLLISQDQYYDAAQHLRAVDKHFCFKSSDECSPSNVQSFSDIPYMQEFRYDAFGRRILAVTLQEPPCVQQNPVQLLCRGYIERTAYDGDQLLYEVRMPFSAFVTEPDLEVDTGAVASYENTAWQYGRVVYTHGLGIDDPVDIVRVGYDTLFPGPNLVIPLPDWRGGYDAGVLANGAVHVCSQSPADSVYRLNSNLCFNFEGFDPQFGIYHQDLFLQTPYILFTGWHGSLVAGRRDLTNQIYLRNRYYDPQTGRFTQEDPIGLAGGLNTYGFAGGDPFNYRDPFGLCSQADNWSNCPPGTAAGNMQAIRGAGRLLKPAEGPLQVAGLAAVSLPTVAADAAMVTLGIGGTATLYRGVSAAEAADVAATGELRTLEGGMEDIKHVTNSAEAAGKWNALMGNGADAQILKITVPRDATASFTSLGRIDGIGQAWTAPVSALKNAQIQILNLTPK